MVHVEGKEGHDAASFPVRGTPVVDDDLPGSKHSRELAPDRR